MGPKHVLTGLFLPSIELAVQLHLSSLLFLFYPLDFHLCYVITVRGN
uniref:Uncharacterized protein n=1 Tax=Arundo donax TaxID=35708 RepID=A0A0A9FBU8_ARUDO